MGTEDPKNIIYTTNITLLDEPEPIRDRPWYASVGRRLIALIFALATLFLFGGVYQFLQLQKTPEDASVGQYEAVTDLPTRSIPSIVFVLSESESMNTDSVRTLVDKSNEILSQASVQLESVRVQTISVDNLDVPVGQVAASPSELKDLLPDLKANRLYVVVTSGLTGINGVAFPGRQIVSVAEYTSSFDFRVLAHEVGHILSLDHVPDRANLMYSGSSGTLLTPAQAKTANQSAEAFIVSDS
jgi:hypothetical protein